MALIPWDRSLIPWYRVLILGFFSEGETFMDDVPIMGDVDDMEVDYSDTLEATTLVMGGSDVAIMADVEEDMEESTVGMIRKMYDSNDIVIYIYIYISTYVSISYVLYCSLGIYCVGFFTVLDFVVSVAP